MKKYNLQAIAIILGFVLIIIGIVYIKYLIWRAEHPYAELWTFFIPK